MTLKRALNASQERTKIHGYDISRDGTASEPRGDYQGAHRCRKPSRSQQSGGDVLQLPGQLRCSSMGEAGQPADANAVRAMWVGIITAFPNIHIEPGPLYHGDTHVFMEVRMTGTHQGDFVGIPATGRSFDARVACLYEFEEDQLVCERVYFDFAGIMRQLGVLPL